jgi:hypothetical protein
MDRRSLLQLLAGAATLPGSAALAQTPAALSADAVPTLRAVATAVLPSALDATAAAGVVDGFAAWLREYRPGADMGYGYGIVRHRTTPAISLATYHQQLAALERTSGAGFAGQPVEARRRLLAAALDAAGIKDLPGTPNGVHVVADFMSYYFRGTSANDLCYQAKIGRDRCRTLAGSSRRPDPLTQA